MPSSFALTALALLLFSYSSIAQEATRSQAHLHLGFEGQLRDSEEAPLHGTALGQATYAPGLKGKALRLAPSSTKAVELNTDLASSAEKDFTVQFWVKSQIAPSQATLVLASKDFPNRSLASQKASGWAFYLSHGTWAWNLGSGKRRLTYERDNGDRLPINDNKWHQLTMSHDSADSEIRLYYDGQNAAIYKIGDKDGFDFTSLSPLTIGSPQKEYPQRDLLPLIKKGASDLSKLVHAFQDLGLGKLEPKELEDLIVDPKKLIANRSARTNPGRSPSPERLKPLLSLRSALGKNPYTTYQVKDFMKVAPLLKLYSWNGKAIVIDPKAAKRYRDEEHLAPVAFDLDELSLWDRVLTSSEIQSSYAKHRPLQTPEPRDKATSLTSAVWNIHHGGKHETKEANGWDSRQRIVEMLKESKADVIMMQETYSSGDFIAAELGYFFATTSDWDYLNQGSNISVLSRYPIKKVYVPKTSSFMNVAAKIALSKTQDIYVMSNWYGMDQFPAVHDFHKNRFVQSATIPILFGGDFNAVPHLDGGKSLASEALIEAGFTDAFRSLHPNPKDAPGATHENGQRIDQLYFKGASLSHASTKIISTWKTGFPSDHFMILSNFSLTLPGAKAPQEMPAN